MLVHGVHLVVYSIDFKPNVSTRLFKLSLKRLKPKCLRNKVTYPRELSLDDVHCSQALAVTPLEFSPYIHGLWKDKKFFFSAKVKLTTDLPSTFRKLILIITINFNWIQSGLQTSYTHPLKRWMKQGGAIHKYECKPCSYEVQTLRVQARGS